MKVPYSWLKEYVDLDITAQELTDKLFDCGFEVEELLDLGAEISRVVVGEVLSCEAVEGTHLFTCQVNCGEYGKLSHHERQSCRCRHSFSHCRGDKKAYDRREHTHGKPPLCSEKAAAYENRQVHRQPPYAAGLTERDVNELGQGCRERDNCCRNKCFVGHGSFGGDVS